MPKVAVVTGGGRGIGAAAATRLAQDGYAVAILYKSNEVRALALVESFSTGAAQMRAYKCDVSDARQVEEAFARIDRDFGGIDLLVNNAGTNGRVVPFADIDEATFREVFDTNLFGTFLCAQQAVRRMSTKTGGKGGVIVNVSSVAARTGGMPGHVHYAASKGAVDVFGFALAKEVAPLGIRVVTVRPGIIDTEIQAFFKQSGAIDKALATVPLGRMGQASEIANAISWLASPDASYVTGSIFDISGGR